VKHFSLTEWADFVRGVVTPEQRASMQKHLDENCSRCNKTVQLWTSLAEFSRQETAYEPPAGALRIAESYLLPFKLASRQGRALQLAQLTLDSFERPVLEGIRGFDPIPRQLMYQLGDVVVDLRLEPNPASNLMVLAGQVVDAQSQEDGLGLAGIPVSLLSKGDIVFEITTNELGEFQFSFERAENLELLIGIESSALLVLIPDFDVGAA
jgi:hypothetical protein